MTTKKENAEKPTAVEKVTKRAHMAPDRVAARNILRKAQRAHYTDALPEKVLAEMSSGRSRVEVCAILGIHPRTFNKWMKDEGKEEFQWAVELGEQLCYQWWMNTSRAIIDGKRDKYNATLWIFCMKNLFGWRDVKSMDPPSSGKEAGPSSKPNLKRVLDAIPDSDASNSTKGKGDQSKEGE